MSAPVCHVSPSQTIEQKRRAQQNSQTTTPVLPSVPKAVDLPSVIHAVTQLTKIVNMLTGATDNQGLGSFSTRGSDGSGGAAGTSGKAGKAGQKGEGDNKKQKGRWTECQRVVEKVRVFQEDAVTGERNEDNYVDIERINLLVMQDTVTGALWTWKR